MATAFPRVQQTTADKPVAGSWAADPIAARILADLSLNPPPLHTETRTYAISRDEWVVYDGPKVDRLRLIYERFMEAAMLASYAGDRAPYKAMQLADPMYRDGPSSVPQYLWLSSPVDRAVFEAVKGRVS